MNIFKNIKELILKRKTIVQKDGLFFIQRNKIYLLSLGCYPLNDELKSFIIENYECKETDKTLYDFSKNNKEAISNYEIILLINNLIHLQKSKNVDFEELMNIIPNCQDLFFNEVLDIPIAKKILSKNLNYLKKITPLVYSESIFSKSDNYNFIRKYTEFNTIEEVYNYVTNNTKVEFKKELKNYIYDNLFTTYNELNLFSFNTQVLEPIRLVFILNNNEIKSMKQLLFYTEHLHKITKNDYNWWTISPYDIVNDTIKLVDLCKDSSKLKILRKINQMPHLFKDYSSFLEKNNLILDLTKEKKFYYPYRMLSRKFAQKTKNYKLKNDNYGFNSSPSNYFKLIKDFNELFELGITLSNCSGNSETIDYYNEHFNFTIKDVGQNIYQGSIKNGKLNQLKGFKNSSPPDIVIKNLYKKLISDNYIDKKQTLSDFKKRCKHQFV